MILRIIILVIFITFSLQADPWQNGKSYKEGDLVQSSGKVYKCLPWPYTGWCGLFSPASSYGKKAWAATSLPATSSNETSTTTAKTWTLGTSYKEGELVARNGKTYKCKSWPYTGWCASYDPAGYYGYMAWDKQNTTPITNNTGNNSSNSGSPNNTNSTTTGSTENNTNSTTTGSTENNTNSTTTGSSENNTNSTTTGSTENNTNSSTTGSTENNTNSTTTGSSENNTNSTNTDNNTNSTATGSSKNNTNSTTPISSNTTKSNNSTENTTTDTTSSNWTFPDWSDQTLGISIKKGELLITNPKLKRTFQSARVAPGTPVISLTDPSQNPSNVQRVQRILKESSWNYLFPWRNSIYTYQDFLKAIAKFPGVCSETNLSLSLDDTCKKELATIFSHVNQETGAHSPQNAFSPPAEEWRQSFYFTREVGCEKSAGCQYRSGCDTNYWSAFYPCANGARYYGRGAKQLSYPYNYGPFSKALFGDVSVLLNDPDRVAREGWLAVSSAFWFYVTPQSPKPSMHDIVTGFWQPSEKDRAAGITAGFGATINVINGGLECGFASAQASNRVKYYKEFMKYFGLEISEKKQFPSDGAGAIPTYWDKDWKSGRCKLVTWQTGYSIFFPNNYKSCVMYYYGTK